MEINLKKKVMLAVLAGNMLCMGQGLAYSVWYGDSDNANGWKGASQSGDTTFPTSMPNARASDANLELNANGNYDSVSYSGVKLIFAGFSRDSAITNNKLTIANVDYNALSTLSNIYAGYGLENVTEVTGNTLEINSGKFREYIGFFGGQGSGCPVSGNWVNIKGGTFDKNFTFYGGSCSGSGTVSGNGVKITGGEFTADGIKIYGGNGSTSYINFTSPDEVNGNTVEITATAGTFGKVTIYGGNAEGNKTASGNIVDIAGGTFNTDGFKLYGGYITSTGTSTGNTLNLKIKMGGRANEVKYFQIMNFTLPSDITDGQTMLKTTTMKFDTTNTTINVDASAATLNGGEIITLIDSTNSPEGIWTAGTITGAEGTITLDGNNIIFTVTATPPPPPPPPPPARNYDKEKAPVEGMAVAAAMVNASADLASGEGMSSLVANTAGGTDTFGAMSAGSSKYKTGSHVDVDGWGVIVGAGTTKKWDNGNATTYGLFFEYGKGDFDTYNGNVHGDGNAENKGVGIMIRHQLENNTYFEGNVRYGKQETEWSESELGGYETDSKYYGAMVGFGKIYKKGNNKLDTYLRYAYGHVGACDATLKDGTDYHFESVKSHRVRTGVRYTFGQRETGFKPYIGAAWEHEFNGEAKATIRGMGEAPAPSMKGNTGIFELGFDWDDDSKWVVGLGANAYVGKRKGWDGMARVFYNF